MFVQNKNFGQSELLQFNYQLNGYDYPSHIHQFAEIGYVIDGGLDIIVNGQRVSAHAGDFIYIAPFHVHEYITPEYCDALICAFPNSLTPDFFTGFDGRSRASALFCCRRGVEDYFRSVFIEGGLGPVMNKLDRSVGNYTDTYYIPLGDPAMLFGIRSCFYAILGEFMKNARPIGGADGTETLSRLLLWLEKHYAGPVRLTAAAAALGYSSNYLSHRIKKLSGMSFCELVSYLRVERAIGLLRENSSRRVIDVALDCGFANERGFHRAFRSVTGKTPGEYMRSQLSSDGLHISKKSPQ